MSNLQQQSVDRPAETNLSVSRTPDAFSPATISIPAVDSPPIAAATVAASST